MCQKCKSLRIAKINGKTSDMCFTKIVGVERDGYVPRDMGIGGGDYLVFSYCLDCGQMQGAWPADRTEMEDAAP